MATRLPLHGHRSAFAIAVDRVRQAAPRRRTSARQRQLPESLEPACAEPLAEAAGTEGAAQALTGILHTATELLGAKRGFLLICNDAGVMEINCVRDMRPADAMDLVLTQASLVVRTVLRERQPVAADELGRAFRLEANAYDSRRAALFCMPLDLGDRRSGLLCALRGSDASMIGALDLEILQGLCDQAALVIGATSACTALAQLEACIKAGSSFPLPRISI
jgi:GAF domain-containing protein